MISLQLSESKISSLLIERSVAPEKFSSAIPLLMMQLILIKNLKRLEEQAQRLELVLKKIKKLQKKFLWIQCHSIPATALSESKILVK